VDFGDLNDKAIKGLMYLSKIVSKFYLYIHEQLLKYLFMDGYLWLTLEKTNIWMILMHVSDIKQ
jgi:hypothetical protein